MIIVAKCLIINASICLIRNASKISLEYLSNGVQLSMFNPSINEIKNNLWVL